MVFVGAVTALILPSDRSPNSVGTTFILNSISRKTMNYEFVSVAQWIDSGYHINLLVHYLRQRTLKLGSFGHTTFSFLDGGGLQLFSGEGGPEGMSWDLGYCWHHPAADLGYSCLLLFEVMKLQILRICNILLPYLRLCSSSIGDPVLWESTCLLLHFMIRCFLILGFHVSCRRYLSTYSRNLWGLS